MPATTNGTQKKLEQSIYEEENGKKKKETMGSKHVLYARDEHWNICAERSIIFRFMTIR